MPPIDNFSSDEDNEGSEPDNPQFQPPADSSSLAGVGENDERGFQDAWNYLRAGVDSSARIAEAAHGERERQQSSLISWAEQTHRLILADAFEPLVLVSDDTSEHKVRHRLLDDRAIKVTWLGFYGQTPVVRGGKLERVNATPAQYMARQILQNLVFNGRIVLEGIHVSEGPSFIIGEPSGQPSFVISQPWYPAADKTNPHPSPEAVNAFMQAQSFVPVRGSYFGWVRPQDGVIITDAKPDNFVLTAVGIVPIDLQIAQVNPVLIQQLVVD